MVGESRRNSGSNSVWLKGAATTLEDNVIASYNFTPWQGQQAEDYQTQQKDKVAKQTRIRVLS
jgi:chitinase